MPTFDHLTMIAPTLDEGIRHLGETLGIELGNAATHTDMGTHDRRVRLGADRYLEVIAIDPDGQAPAIRPRWFGLDRRGRTVRSRSDLSLRGFWDFTRKAGVPDHP